MSGAKREHSLQENKGTLASTEFYDDYECLKTNTETVKQLDHKSVLERREMCAFLLSSSVPVHAQLWFKSLN